MSSSTIRKGKTLNAQSQELICNVFEYFTREHENGGPLINVNSVQQRVADACKISTRTISRIIHRKRKSDENEELQNYKYKILNKVSKDLKNGENGEKNSTESCNNDKPRLSDKEKVVKVVREEKVVKELKNAANEESNQSGTKRDNESDTEVANLSPLLNSLLRNGKINEKSHSSDRKKIKLDNDSMVVVIVE